MYDEDDLLPISALSHLVFCERRCALMYIEGAWAENRFTTLGRQMHDRAHEGAAETRGDCRIVRGLRLRSLRLGLVGQADVVEFHRCKPDDGLPGTALEGRSGLWRPFPVEYKSGAPKPDRCDEVQLCAQALCLEEMMDTPVWEGALFYGKPKRRQEVGFTDELRGETERLALRLHEVVIQGRTPAAARGAKCRGCSLLEVCMPTKAGAARSVSAYLSAAVAEQLGENGGEP
jgi:CRISPR-associated exonuclease Cas4